MNYTVVLSAARAELVSFGVAAVASADSLLADAELLLKHDRWPRAHALAVLAAEEYGKACGLMVLSMVPPEFRARARPRLLLARHEVKMLGAALVMRLLDAGTPGVAGRILALPDLAVILSDAETQAAESNEAKKGGLYADIGEDGLLRLPSDVTEQDARSSVAMAREVAASAAAFRDPEAVGRLAAPPPGLVAGLTPLFTELLDATAGAGPEEVAAAARDCAARAPALAAGLNRGWPSSS